MSVDELDAKSPFFDAVYAGARSMDLPLEALISENATGQYELTLRYRDLVRAADDIVIAKRLIRCTARRFGMEACFMAKPFGNESGSGVHLHLSLGDGAGRNLFADQPDGTLSPLMLHAIGGVRRRIGATMLILAPFLNSSRGWMPIPIWWPPSHLRRRWMVLPTLALRPAAMPAVPDHAGRCRATGWRRLTRWTSHSSPGGCWAT